MLRCVMVLWGDLIPIFEEYILPLHIKSLEIPVKLRSYKNFRFEIYTKNGDFSNPLWNKLRERVGVSINEIAMPTDLKLVESNWLHGKIIDGDNSGDYFCPMCPDWIIPEDFYETIFQNLEKYDNLLSYCPRTSKDGILQDIAGRDSLPKEELLELGIKHLHPCQRNLFIDSSNFAYWASAIWFPDLTVGCFHPHPLVMKLQGYKWPGGSVDGYMTGLLDPAKTKYLQPCELPLFEFSGPEKTTMATGRPFDEILFTDFIRQNITARQVQWFNNLLYFDPYISVAGPDAQNVLQFVNNVSDLHVGPTCQTQ